MALSAGSGADDSGGGLDAVVKLIRDREEVVVIAGGVADIGVEREVFDVVLEIRKDFAVPAGPVDMAPKLEAPAAISWTFGSVHLMSLAASRANFP